MFRATRSSASNYFRKATRRDWCSRTAGWRRSKARSIRITRAETSSVAGRTSGRRWEIFWRSRSNAPLLRAREDERDVVGLFGGADPVHHGLDHFFRDAGERRVVVDADEVQQALGAELAEVVLGLDDAVRKSDEQVAGAEHDGSIFPRGMVEQPDHQAAGT